MTDDLFAPPPFDPVAARGTLERAWRELKLQHREGRFERGGKPVARLEVGDGHLVARLARRPVTHPDWDTQTLRSAADVRRCTDELKKRLALWDRED